MTGSASALVPYSEAVNAQPVINKIQTTGVTKKKCSGWGWYKSCWWETTYPDCVAERTGTEKYTDAFADEFGQDHIVGLQLPELEDRSAVQRTRPR
jgi:hypothetical protein